MKTICLYFEIHQIIHLKRYRFFEIGTDHYYYDDYANEQGINDVAIVYIVVLVVSRKWGAEALDALMNSLSPTW